MEVNILKTVFIPGIVNYDFLKQLPQQIADQFHNNGYRVIFCGIDNNFYMKREIKKNYFIYSNTNYALKDIAENKIKIDIMYNTWAKNYNFSNILKPDITIYHCCDMFDEWKKFEGEMLKVSDLVFCTSQLIYDVRSNEHNRVYICRNACNSEMINKKEYNIIDDFKFVKRPIFCFSGAIGKWVSTNLIKNVGEKYFTTLAGIQFGKEKPSNIYDYGVLEHDKLIDFYYNCDFGLIPFNTKNEITRAANPIKLWEYLACGLPVLSTKWVETELPEFKDVVYATNDKDQFISHAEAMSLLSKNDLLEIKEECYKIARNNTWEIRFQTIQKEIDRL